MASGVFDKHLGAMNEAYVCSDTLGEKGLQV
jgi:hypothetical protein